jgi:hypothetical protein
MCNRPIYRAIKLLPAKVPSPIIDIPVGNLGRKDHIERSIRGGGNGNKEQGALT